MKGVLHNDVCCHDFDTPYIALEYKVDRCVVMSLGCTI